MLLLGTLLPLGLFAQGAYPTKPVTIIVPFPPGGTSDVMGKMIAEELSREFQRPFTVTNIAGAGGATGTAQAARATPDGYTLVATGVGQNAVAHGLDARTPYDSRRDFAHISMIHTGPNVLVVPANSPFSRFEEFIAFGKRNTSNLTYGYTYGASGHMAMELLKQTVTTCVGSRINPSCITLHVDGVLFAGGGPLLAALAEGKLQMAFLNQDAVIPHIKAGKLRALAVTSIFRNPALPDVPTISESGYPAFSALSWSGLSAPAGTPKDILDKLETAVVKIMGSARIRQQMESKGFVVPPLGSDEYNAFLGKEIERWSRVIKVAGIKPPT
jgi:tripartite-type tricarboxylate transporter receptor subunit TctC